MHKHVPFYLWCNQVGPECTTLTPLISSKENWTEIPLCLSAVSHTKDTVFYMGKYKETRASEKPVYLWYSQIRGLYLPKGENSADRTVFKQTL